jgi:hypothetical protein
MKISEGWKNDERGIGFLFSEGQKDDGCESARDGRN